MTVFKTARGRAVPVGRDEVEVRSRRVSPTHAWRGRRSRRSEISSMGCGDHQDGSCGFSGRGFDTRGYFLFWLPCSRWNGCCGFGLKLLRPGLLPGGGHFRLPGHLRDRLRRGIWNRGGVMAVALATGPPRTTWLHPSPRANCSAEGPAYWAFGAAGWPVDAFLGSRCGAWFASAAFASLHFAQPR